MLWRSASALIVLVANALDLTAVPLSRHGDEIVIAAGLDAPSIAAGAMHSRGSEPSDKAAEKRTRRFLLRVHGYCALR